MPSGSVKIWEARHQHLISPDDWRVRFKPRHKRMIDRLRKENPEIIIIMHSDGAVAPLIDDFAEIGVDVYNPVQPNVDGSDPNELKDRYGEKICFFGGIDQQVLLPKGDNWMIRDRSGNVSVSLERAEDICLHRHILSRLTSLLPQLKL